MKDWEADRAKHTLQLLKAKPGKKHSFNQQATDRKAIKLIRKGSMKKGMQLATGFGCGNIEDPRIRQQMLDKHPLAEEDIQYPEADTEEGEIDIQKIFQLIKWEDQEK